MRCRLLVALVTILPCGGHDSICFNTTPSLGPIRFVHVPTDGHSFGWSGIDSLFFARIHNHHHL